MDYDRPFIVIRDAFSKKRGLLSEAIEFLKVEDVPSDYRATQLLLLGFFQSGKMPLVADQFQQLVNVLCYSQGPSEPAERKNILSKIFSESLTELQLQLISPLFNLLVLHLALQKTISLPPAPLFSGPKPGKISFTPWFEKLPSEVRFWCVVSAKSVLEKYADSLEPSFVEFAWQWFANNDDHKKMSAASIVMRHYFAYQGVTSFDLSLLVETQKLIVALTTNVRSARPALWLYSQLKGEDIYALYREGLNEQVVRIGSVHRIYHDVIVAFRQEAGVPDPYDFSLGAKSVGADHAARKHRSAAKNRKFETHVNTDFGVAQFRPSISPKPEGCSVYELVTKNSVQFGEYFLTAKALGKFRPDKLYEAYPKNLWLAHQKDFLDDGYEKNTKKGKASALRILNTYLFSYLPWFKANVDPEFQVPECLEEFDPNFFVRHTHSFILRLDPNTVLPVTFPQFQEKCLDIRTPGGTANVNARQANQNNITNFFQNYIKLESLSISNPMDVAKDIRGFSYAESQKKKLDYDYWWLLREFLFAFASCSLRVRKDMLEGKIISESWKEKFLEYAEATEVRLGNVTLDMSKMEGLDSFNPSTVHVFATFLCFVSRCGIRFSNAFWLDARTFDAHVKGVGKDTDLVKVYINTDKARITAFNSHVEASVMKLLRILNDIRGSVFSDDAVFYQNNEKSKWGAIVPLFRFNPDKHDESDDSYFNDCMTDLLFSFQSLLNLTGLDFSSYLYPKVHGLTQDDYEIYKASRTQAPLRTFVIDRSDRYSEAEIAEKLRPVSLIKYKSSVTVHGLRKTFDSFMSNFFTQEQISEFWTGQTPLMVGFYSSNTLGEYRLAQRVADSGGLPFVIRKDGKDADKIVSDLKEKGIPSDSLMMSSVNIEDFDLNEEYKKAPDREISVNRTHICPYGNVCPKKIKVVLGKKLCGICPAALSFPGDAPAIAATIRKIGDQIADLTNSIKSGDLTKAEREDSQEKRMDLIAEFSAWMVRHDQLIQMTNGEILLGEDGTEHYREKLVYHKPDADWSEEKKNIWRIIETSDAKTLQSDRLKHTAQRYARDMISRINPSLMEQIQTQLDIDPVKVAALFVEKTARLQGMSLDAVVKSIEDYSQKSSEQSLRKLIGVTDGE